MLPARQTVARAFASQAAIRQGISRGPMSLFSTSSSQRASGDSGYRHSSAESPRMQNKDQVQAEEQAKDPQNADLGKESSRSKPEDVSGGLHTPGVKEKSRDDESIGRAVKDKASG
ncbi:hypothetical protein C8A03DRAFT_33193 [Achaetomium macrosporum]|uniref:Uncharacterized protein n=1 Tax=Achaetomium macrosporum TaxID=79813 RepID=A0AAN7CC43_9PEZI|nr:hypothetical protein C8A03DRAFT_33193 [Achaetomium macrosporum]